MFYLHILHDLTDRPTLQLAAQCGNDAKGTAMLAVISCLHNKLEGTMRHLELEGYAALQISEQAGEYIIGEGGSGGNCLCHFLVQ